MKLRFGKGLAKTSALRLGNISIKSQLVISLMVVIIPFILMGVITYRYNMDIVTRMLSESKMHTLGETARNVDQMLCDIESRARQVGWDADVQDFLSKDENLKDYDDFKTSDRAQKTMAKLMMPSGNIDTIVVVPCKHKGFTSTVDGKGFMSHEDAMHFDWYGNLDKGSDTGRWILTSNIVDSPPFNIPTVTCVSPVKLLSSFEVVGHVLVSVDRNAFRGVIGASSGLGDEQVFLTDGGGNAIAETGEGGFAVGMLSPERQTNGQGWYYRNSGEGQYLVAYATLPRYGWQLVSAVSVSAVSAELMDLSKMMYAIIVICVLLSLILAVVLYRGITKPLDVFVARMQSIAHGDFTAERTDGETKNEIRKIYNDFNWMSGRIAGLMEKNNETMMQKRDAELRALQAQINPHFLYNVLDTINWMAILKDEDEISKSVTSLSAFYRTILNNGKDTVTIGQEIEHVKAYIAIEKLRYKNDFDVTYMLDESLFGLYTLKFILQPFVENALMHAFSYAGEGNRITLRLYGEEGGVVFEVADNGEGMSEEKAGRILAEKTEGYGIANVEERIKLKYGDEYGISIRSGPDTGTTIRIFIPRVEKSAGSDPSCP
jgi:two-component system sensor histidine kinase YesM